MSPCVNERRQIHRVLLQGFAAIPCVPGARPEAPPIVIP